MCSRTLPLAGLALLLAVGRAGAAPGAADVAHGIPGAPRVEEDPRGLALLDEARVEGAFVLLDVARGVLFVASRGRAGERHSPFSTFKIPNTLIGLESGVIPGPELELRWDGRRRDVSTWNRDQTLATAMRDSVVWFHQEIARRIGLDRMGRMVDGLGYGNGRIGAEVDRFWLDGALRISPLEQVAFLRRLQAGALPVAPRNAALVRQLIVLEQRPGFTLRGKTGLGREGTTAVGWLVGEVERDGCSYVYATLVVGADGDLERIAPVRRELTERLLALHGAFPERR